jgi:hypothetical protein
VSPVGNLVCQLKGSLGRWVVVSYHMMWYATRYLCVARGLAVLRPLAPRAAIHRIDRTTLHSSYFNRAKVVLVQSVQVCFSLHNVHSAIKCCQVKKERVQVV